MGNNLVKKLKALTLFSNVGIDEWYLKDAGIDVVVANELIEDRANFYKKLYPDVNMICGDITDDEIYSKIIKAAEGFDVTFRI